MSKIECEKLQEQIDKLRTNIENLEREIDEGFCEIDDIAELVAKRLDMQTFLKRPKITCRKK